MSLGLISPEGFFNWASVPARLEKHESSLETEWTIDMRYKRWMSRVEWEAANTALANRYPSVHGLLRLGNSLLQLHKHASPAHQEEECIVTGTLVLIVQIVCLGDILRSEIETRVRLMSDLILAIENFYALTDNLCCSGLITDVDPLEWWYDCAMRQFPHLRWSLRHRETLDSTIIPEINIPISPECPWEDWEDLQSLNIRQEYLREMFHRVNEEWLLAAVALAGMHKDLTEELTLSGTPCGRGASCNVYAAKWNFQKGTKKLCKRAAVKVFHMPNQGTSQYVAKLSQRMKDELDIWAKLEHPHILPLYGMHWIGGLPGLVSPWCKNGDITKYLKDLHGPAKSAIALELLEQVALGLKYLHMHYRVLVHGDLKGANILVSDDGQALLCDFGLAAIEAAAAGTSFVDLPGTSAKGTYRWMAPELVQDDDSRLTRASDIWAFGCVLLEVLSGRFPWQEKTDAPQVFLALSRGEIPARPAGIHDRMWKLMLHCWQLIPSARPSVGCVLEKIRAFLGSDELERCISGQLTDASPI